jgi:tyrosyl-DNA phosphodiesterase 1
MKLQSAAQQKQLQYMRPYFCHWAGGKETPTRNTLDTTGAEATKKQIYAGNNAIVKREAGRRRAAPHIKTYIRFSDAREMDRIDWAMVTSANLSTQAWGAAANANGEVRICSWEIGVIVWPDLFADDYPGTIGGECAGEGMVEMVPCFKQDLPLPRLLVGEPDKPQGSIIKKQEQDLFGDGKSRLPAAVVGFRMPYDLPISPYSPNDVPWCATASHTEPDWLGQTWDI